MSALTNLRILFLYQNFEAAAIAAADWDALRPLSKLVSVAWLQAGWVNGLAGCRAPTHISACRSPQVFLSVSSNSLRELPPAVAAMSQLRVRRAAAPATARPAVDVHAAAAALLWLQALVPAVLHTALPWFASLPSNAHMQGLHIEDNPFAQRLPPAPCLLNLVELLLDWKDALRSPDALRACTRLSRLSLHNHAVWAVTVAGQHCGLGADWGGPLLEALAALPALQLLEDVVNPQRPDALAPAVARCMWEAGRRCPRARLAQATSTYVSCAIGRWAALPLPVLSAAAAAAAAVAALAA